ncbi:MAG: hypothetical protein KIS88_09720 [Anaerolineales bacterium]|nr:hypothetical protein [Anaerolineales bacterium]
MSGKSPGKKFRQIGEDRPSERRATPPSQRPTGSGKTAANKYCRNCGSMNEAHTNYCRQCGSRLTSPASNAPRQPSSIHPRTASQSAWKVIGLFALLIAVLYFATDIFASDMFQNASRAVFGNSDNNPSLDMPQPTGAPELIAGSESDQAATTTTGENAAPVPTPFGIHNPSGALEAGTPIIVDDYQLLVDRNSYELGGFTTDNYLSVNVEVKNLTERPRVFQYTPSSLVVKDDTGRIYEYLVGDCSNRRSAYFAVKTIAFEETETVRIGSYDFFLSSSNWCTDGHSTTIPWYELAISPQTNFLIFEFTDFGPFTGFEVWIPIR